MSAKWEKNMPDPIISFTIGQLLTLILSICGAIIALSGAAAVIVKIVAKIKKPNIDQDARLDSQELWLKRHDDRLNLYEIYFKNDKDQITLIKEGNRVQQQAMLALLSHAIDGNNIGELKESKKSLEKYLIER